MVTLADKEQFLVIQKLEPHIRNEDWNLVAEQWTRTLVSGHKWLKLFYLMSEFSSMIMVRSSGIQSYQCKNHWCIACTNQKVVPSCKEDAFLTLPCRGFPGISKLGGDQGDNPENTGWISYPIVICEARLMLEYAVGREDIWAALPRYHWEQGPDQQQKMNGWKGGWHYHFYKG